MRQGKISFRHESLQDRKTIRDILAAINQGIGKGKLSFSDEDDRIVMEPRGLLHLKLTASQEDDRQRIDIRITWQKENRQTKKNKTLAVTS